MIPVCIPTLGEAEMENVTDCLERNWISARGEYVDEFEDRFSDYCDVEHGITTTSGTTALHLALRTIGVGEGDEVIIPTFTIGASAFAVLYCGATPVPVEAKPDTGNMDPDSVAAAVTDDTAAIMPVHIYGHPCDMDPIMDIVDEHDLYVVEDAAEAHGAEYKGERAGSIGDIACFSFYANKLVTTGEGGMVVTDDDNLAERAAWLKDLAYTEDRRYVHGEIGFNYRMTNVQAAIGVGQMEHVEELLEMRRENARQYNELLTDVPGINIPHEAEWAKNSYWMYAITVDKEAFGLSRDELMAELRDRDIGTRRFFVPMHEQPFWPNENVSMPVAEELSETGLYLPSTSHLEEEKIRQICFEIESIGDGKAG